MLTEHDVELMQDIAKCRILTVKQLKELHFKNSQSYVYRRIGMLRNYGVIESRPLIGHGKEGACVFITPKGAAEIGLNPAIARHNTATHMYRWRADISEIYTQLKPLGWDWIDSRAIKDEYDYSPSSLFAGALVRPDGERYLTYVLTPQPIYETVNRVKTEIEANMLISSGIRNVAIFTPKPEALQLGDSPLGTKSLLLLKYPEDIATIGEYLSDPDVLIKRLEPSLDDLTYERTHEPFAELLIHQAGREHYLVELLTHDQAKSYHLARYSYERAMQNKKRGVIILVAPEALSYYRNEFPEAAYPHFRFIEIKSASQGRCPD